IIGGDDAWLLEKLLPGDWQKDFMQVNMIARIASRGNLQALEALDRHIPTVRSTEFCEVTAVNCTRLADHMLPTKQPTDKDFKRYAFLLRHASGRIGGPLARQLVKKEQADYDVARFFQRHPSEAVEVLPELLALHEKFKKESIFDEEYDSHKASQLMLLSVFISLGERVGESRGPILRSISNKGDRAFIAWALGPPDDKAAISALVRAVEIGEQFDVDWHPVGSERIQRLIPYLLPSEQRHSPLYVSCLDANSAPRIKRLLESYDLPTRIRAYERLARSPIHRHFLPDMERDLQLAQDSAQIMALWQLHWR
ncbi:hypothetical protein K2X33_07095, partial [bacterium]|nr:hypothetical protein [bacterium]